jgi:hypothetical protein
MIRPTGTRNKKTWHVPGFVIDLQRRMDSSRVPIIVGPRLLAFKYIGIKHDARIVKKSLSFLKTRIGNPDNKKAPLSRGFIICRGGGITRRDPFRGCVNRKATNLAPLVFCLKLLSHSSQIAPAFVGMIFKQKTRLTSGFVCFYDCRGGGIRTPGPREGSPVFKTGAINRSTTPLFPD